MTFKTHPDPKLKVTSGNGEKSSFGPFQQLKMLFF